VDADCFFDFVRGTLLPHLQPFDGTNPRSVVILDNCSIHHVQSVSELFEAAGVLFLPPYSPDMMPIEEAFSYIKGFLKQHYDCLQSTDDPFPVIHAAFESITSFHGNVWITHAEYCIQIKLDQLHKDAYIHIVINVSVFYHGSPCQNCLISESIFSWTFLYSSSSIAPLRHSS